MVSVYSLFFIARIVMTWYPEIDGTKAPWSLAYNPTEFILKPTRCGASMGRQWLHMA